jgi:hypothetical protein
VNFWWEYRAAWSRRPWLLPVAVIAVLLILAGVIGTVVQNPLAFVFIPGLAVLFLHHLLVQRTSR